MTEATRSRLEDMIGDIPTHLAAVAESHARSDRAALLEHARMGRSICESRDGQVVWVPPEEIFARYGLDEFGRPRA